MKKKEENMKIPANFTITKKLKEEFVKKANERNEVMSGVVERAIMEYVKEKRMN